MTFCGRRLTDSRFSSRLDSVIHLLFLTPIVVTLHYVTVFVGIFLFFLGFTTVTREFQDDLNLMGSLLVASFLRRGRNQSRTPLQKCAHSGGNYDGMSVVTTGAIVLPSRSEI